MQALERRLEDISLTLQELTAVMRRMEALANELKHRF